MIAFKPPGSEWAKNLFGYVGWAFIGMGIAMLLWMPATLVVRSVATRRRKRLAQSNAEGAGTIPRLPGIKLEAIRRQSAPGEKGENRIYVQLVFRCASEAPLEECAGRLLGVWKDSDGNWEQIEPNQALRLNWSPKEDKPIPLLPSVPEVLDVFYTSDRDPHIHFCSNWVPQRAKINLEYPSVLKFEVAVTGRDADSKRSLPTLRVSFKADIRQWPQIHSIEQL